MSISLSAGGDARSDHGSESSFGMHGSVGSNFGENSERSGTSANAAKHAALAKLRERQAKCVRAIRQKSDGTSSVPLPEHVESLPNSASNENVLLSRQVTVNSLASDSAVEPRSPVMNLRDIAKAVEELRLQQSSAGEVSDKLIELASSTGEACKDNSERLGAVIKQLETQSQHIQFLIDAAQKAEALAPALERLAEEEQSRQNELRQLLQADFTAAAESSTQASLKLETISSSMSSQADLIARLRDQEQQSSQANGERSAGHQAKLDALGTSLQELKDSQKFAELSKALENQARQLESLTAEETGRQLEALSRALEKQGRQVDAIRAQEAGQQLQELQRAFESQTRQVESLRAQEASHTAETQRMLETTATQLGKLAAQETGQHLLELQRLIETQLRTIESLRSQDVGQQITDLRKACDQQSSQLQETLRSQDLSHRFGDVTRGMSSSLDALAGTVNSQSSQLEDAANQSRQQSESCLTALKELQRILEGRMEELEVQCKAPSEKFVEIQQALSAQVSSLAELRTTGAQGKSELQHGLEEAQASLTQLKEALSEQRQAFETLRAEEAAHDRLAAVIEQLQSSRAELAGVIQAVDAQGSRLQNLSSEVSSQQLATQAVFSELKETLSARQQDDQGVSSVETHDAVSSMRTTVDAHACQLRDLASEMASHHQTHLQELRDMKASLASQAECDGLKLELQASRNIQANMDSKEKHWEAERTCLREQVGRLEERERELVKQLQEAMVTMPLETPAADPSLKESQARMGRLGGRAMPLSLAALAVVFVVGMVLRAAFSGDKRQALRRSPGRAFLGHFNTLPGPEARRPGAAEIRRKLQACGYRRRPWVAK
eukprot:TRINITY_DN22612_c0_g1_i1.p1 TRINITY_DN22612_c0_g1~~TRINITY_DN22612_c0_g1_i1.p1  ORF type:complete len:846 (-),score=219.24 TRINITY_DN22612_c0_g1_i1:110-2647(-)